MGWRRLAEQAVTGAIAAASAASLVCAQGAGTDTLPVAPEPEFVVLHEPPGPDELTFDPVRGARLLLLDVQHNASGAQSQQYSRTVAQAVSFAGVSLVSQFSVPFDPSYQSVTLHHVRVTRDGVVQDRTDSVHIDIVRQEQSPQLMLTGIKIANLRLDDVRVGDIVDVAMTVNGAQPSLDGHASTEQALIYPLPIERYAFRSTWPGRFSWKALGDAPEVHETREHGRRVLEIEPQPIEPPEPEAFTPPWQVQAPQLIASDFTDWRDVAAWAAPLYAVVHAPETDALAAQIAEENASKPAQIVAALRFVQNEVRYFAVVLGAGGYVPETATETLRTRTGDCKAKTLLFLTLLDSLGVEAHAALVNSNIHQAVGDYPPTASVFDHVIAEVELDGRTYWLDPTAVFQGGTLDTLVQPDYGAALVLDGRRDPLVATDIPHSEEPATLIRETYDLTGGPRAPAHLHAELVYTGESADAARAVYANVAASDIDDTTRRQLAGQYGDVELDGPGVITDDVDANRFSVVYDMTLADPFTTDEPRRSFEATADNIYGPIPPVDADERESPVALLFRSGVRQEIDELLPNVGWDLADETKHIENAAFRFDWSTHLEGLTLQLRAEVTPLADALPASELAAALDDQDAMTDSLSYTVWMSDGAHAAPPQLDLPDIDFDVAPANP